MRAFSFTITLGDGMVFSLVVDPAQCTPFKSCHKKEESVSGDQALLPAHRKIFEHFTVLFCRMPGHKLKEKLGSSVIVAVT